MQITTNGNDNYGTTGDAQYKSDQNSDNQVNVCKEKKVGLDSENKGELFPRLMSRKMIAKINDESPKQK